MIVEPPVPVEVFAGDIRSSIGKLIRENYRIPSGCPFGDLIAKLDATTIISSRDR